MNKIKPQLGQYMAEYCLKEKYNGKYCTEDYYALVNFCEFDCNSSAAMENLYFLIQRYYINSAATNIVIDNLPSIQQQMLFYYYKRNFNLQQISYQLFISTATLSRMRTAILNKLEKALFYKICLDDDHDIYNRNKTLSMINLIDYRLTKLIENQHKKSNIDKIWIDYLCNQREKLAKLLQFMDKCIDDNKAAKGKNLNLACICQKLKDPDSTVSAIAEDMHKKIAFVSHQLKNYKCAVKEIFNGVKS